MEPVDQFNTALSTMFDRMIQANSELRQKTLDLKANCDRLAADNTDALKVFCRFLCICFFCIFGCYFIGTVYLQLSSAAPNANYI